MINPGLLTLLLGLLAGCSGDDDTPKGSYGPSTGWADAQSNGGAASDASEGSAEASGKKSSGGLSGLLGGGDCDDTSLAEAPLDRACITQDLACGQTIDGHTGGGTKQWNGDFYRSKFCTPADSGTYEGFERVYFLPTPAEHEVRVKLDSPCKDLDLFLVTWSSADTCPGMGHAISTCESDITSGGGHVMTQNINNSYSYLVAVEGKRGEAAPFTLTVECEKMVER